MNASQIVARASLFSAVLGLAFVAGSAQAQAVYTGGKIDGSDVRVNRMGTRISWERIVGIIETEAVVGRRTSAPDAPCVVDVHCVVGAKSPFIAKEGYATVDLQTGVLKFEVKGLVLAGDPSWANMGTIGEISMVRGTLVCNDTEPGLPVLVDTGAVHLSESGDAKFDARVDLHPFCAQQPWDTVFVLRTAKMNRGPDPTPDLSRFVGNWIALGAYRTID